MTQAPVRIGLIGAGGIGKTHLASYVHVRDARVVAVCDALEASARAAAQQVNAAVYSDVDRMLQEVELDAVDICTPTSAHVAPAMAAIERGLNVLCEKPLAHTPVAARQMTEAAAARNVMLMNAFCHRFHPPIVFVKNLIDEGQLGEVVMFRNRFAGPNPGVANTWFSRKAVAGGGALLDTSVHSVDLFRFLIGEVTRVQGVVRQTSPAVREVEDTGIALLSTADQRMGVVEACWSAVGGYNVVEVYGTDGAAMVHYWDGFSSRYRTSRMQDWAQIPESGTDRFVAEIQHFVDACLGRSPLMVTGFDGLRAVEIIHAAYDAAAMN